MGGSGTLCCGSSRVKRGIFLWERGTNNYINHIKCTWLPFSIVWGGWRCRNRRQQTNNCRLLPAQSPNRSLLPQTIWGTEQFPENKNKLRISSVVVMCSGSNSPAPRNTVLYMDFDKYLPDLCHKYCSVMILSSPD